MSGSNKLGSADYRLKNLTNALYLTGTDDVAIRTGITGNINVAGDINVPGNVQVYSSPEDPVHVHMTELGTYGNLKLFMPVQGTVAVNNFPTSTTITSGNLAISTGGIAVGNSNPFAVNVVGNVNIGTLPEIEIKNDTGNPIPVTWVYGNSADAIPWEVQVARGKISGVTGISISGYQAAVPDSWMPVWGIASAYTYFPSAQQVRVWSNSASDTNVWVTVIGLDATYAIISETVTLTNGATGVLTTNNFLRVNNLNIAVDAMNVGTIYAGNSGKTITLSTIDPNAGRSQMSIYTVPAGYTFYLTQVNMYTNQVGSQTGLYRSYTVSNTGVTNIVLTFPFVDNYSSRKVVPRPYLEKTDIQWQAQSSQGTSRIGIQVEGYLIANSVT